jgi:hypothetical protein
VPPILSSVEALRLVDRLAGGDNARHVYGLEGR